MNLPRIRCPESSGQISEHWSIEAHHYVRDVTFREDKSTSRTGSGSTNLATIRAITAALKDAGYLHIAEGRHDHTTQPKFSASTAWIKGQTWTFTERAGALYRLPGTF